MERREATNDNDSRRRSSVASLPPFDSTATRRHTPFDSTAATVSGGTASLSPISRHHLPVSPSFLSLPPALARTVTRHHPPQHYRCGGGVVAVVVCLRERERERETRIQGRVVV
ncbi:hypothetical protein HanXRQr2_Chr13g0593001 [Helianthus annuus]|uniref:Uncharacterized protein n=1 Tax=Helianthus annuus TaxID=4232 RepID=A0A9K3EIG9_HELAN|nr:hypothetical protein HanXRQr2_Chr13g0593001 [Helianthus annuus]